MNIAAIDPGSERSAFVRVAGGVVRHAETVPNEVLLASLRNAAYEKYENTSLVVEMIASYGMPVGREVFETCVWIGKFIEAWNGYAERLYRKDVKMHLCGSMRAKDGNIRQALIDKFGGKEKAIGTKKMPGPLYGIHGDEWAALAVAVTYAETHTTAGGLIVDDKEIPF